MGTDDGPAPLRPRPASEPRSACGRRIDPLSALSRSADASALRPGNPDRAARTAGVVAGRTARARPAAARTRIPPPRRPSHDCVGGGARARAPGALAKAVAELMRAPYRVIAITGASSGLGAALARSYAGPGVVLGLVARNRERLARAAEACRMAGAHVESALIDV